MKRRTERKEGHWVLVWLGEFRWGRKERGGEEYREEKEREKKKAVAYVSLEMRKGER